MIAGLIRKNHRNPLGVAVTGAVSVGFSRFLSNRSEHPMGVIALTRTYPVGVWIHFFDWSNVTVKLFDWLSWPLKFLHSFGATPKCKIAARPVLNFSRFYSYCRVGVHKKWVMNVATQSPRFKKLKKKKICPQKVEKTTLKSCSEFLKSTFFLTALPKRPKQKNSCSKMKGKFDVYSLWPMRQSWFSNHKRTLILATLQYIKSNISAWNSAN